MTKLRKIAIILPKGIPMRYIKGKFNVYSLSTVPLTIPALVSLIPKELNIKVEIYDESIETINKESIQADLIVISAMTPTVNRAYIYAAYFRSKGIPVVIGGIHATLNPQEVLQHADSVICGIAVESFPQLLKDFNENKMKRIYTQQENLDLSNMPMPDRDWYKSKSAFKIKLNGIQATYGCNNSCEFCVQPYVCSGYHQRPVEEVIKDAKKGGGLFGGEEGGDSDNLTEEAIELVVRTGKASASYMQRRFRIGYARAARLLDILEDRGVIGPGEGAKPREVLMRKEDLASAVAGGGVDVDDESGEEFKQGEDY